MGQHLTVYHIRSKLAKTITDSYTPILRKPRTVKVFDLSTDMPFEARLFISKAELKPPPWVNFLKVGFDNLPTPSRKIHSAVLFVRIPYGETKEIFAFTFGQGRHLLKSHSYDDDYGLRTALNAIYQQEETIIPDRLKNVSAKTIAGNTMRTKRQTDKQTSFEAFGVDVQRDILSSITGIPVQTEVWNNQVSGSASLSANPTITFGDLGDYCQSLMEHHEQDWYKRDFDWIDNRKSVNDPELIQHLKEKVIDSIKEKTENTSLAIPELNEFENIIESYLSLEERRLSFDPYIDNLATILENAGLIDKVNVERFDDEWLLVFEYENGETSEWPLLDCLSGEIKSNFETGVLDKTYVISEGEFYEISTDYINALDAFIKTVPENKDPIPDCHEILRRVNTMNRPPRNAFPYYCWTSNW